MADREQPYDPYIPSGERAGGSAGQHGNQRTAALQAVGGPLLDSERRRGELQEEGTLRWMVLVRRFGWTATDALEHSVPVYNALVAIKRSASVRRLCMSCWPFHQVLAVAVQYHLNPFRPSRHLATTLAYAYCAKRRHYGCLNHTNLRDIDRSSSLQHLNHFP